MPQKLLAVHIPRLAKNVMAMVAFTTPVVFCGQLLPWSQFNYSLIFLLLSILCLFLIWKVAFKRSLWRWFRLVVLIVCVAVLGTMLVHFTMRPFYPVKGRIYVVNLPSQVHALNPFKFTSLEERVDANSKIVVANHPLHWWLSQYLGRKHPEQVIHFGNVTKAGVPASSIPLTAKHISKAQDIHGIDYTSYTARVTEPGIWSLRSHVSPGAVTPGQLDWKNSAGYSHLPVELEIEYLLQGDTLHWTDVVIENERPELYRYVALLAEFLDGDWDGTSEEARAALLKSVPSERERLRILSIDLQVNAHIWQGNILATQYIPQLKQCEKLIRRYDPARHESDQLLLWCLQTTIAEAKCLGPRITAPMADLEPNLKRALAANQPEVPYPTPANHLGLKKWGPLKTARDSNFLHRRIREGREAMAWNEKLLDSTYDALASRGIPEVPDPVTRANPTYRAAWWSSLENTWSTVSYIKLMELAMQAMGGDGDGVTAYRCLSLLEALPAIENDLRRLERLKKEAWKEPQAPQAGKDPLGVESFEKLFGDEEGSDGFQIIWPEGAGLPQDAFAGTPWLHAILKTVHGSDPSDKDLRECSAILHRYVASSLELDPELEPRWRRILADKRVHCFLKNFVLSLGRDGERFPVAGLGPVRKWIRPVLAKLDESMETEQGKGLLLKMWDYLPVFGLDAEDPDSDSLRNLFISHGMDKTLQRDLSQLDILDYARREARLHAKPADPPEEERSIHEALVSWLAVQPCRGDEDTAPTPQERMVRAALFWHIISAKGEKAGADTRPADANDPPARWALELGRTQSRGILGGGYPLTAECLVFSMLVPVEKSDPPVPGDTIKELPYEIFYRATGLTPREYVESITTSAN